MQRTCQIQETLQNSTKPSSINCSNIVVTEQSAVIPLPTSNLATFNEFIFGDHNARKLIVLDIPLHILEAMYAAVSILPLTQYEVICHTLKQILSY
jgi:uncharacterized membrane protein